MHYMKRSFFAALLACAIGALAPGGVLAPVKIDAADFHDETFREQMKEEAARNTAKSDPNATEDIVEDAGGKAEATAKADPNATEDIVEDAGAKPEAQAKAGYVLRGEKVYRVDGGMERLLEDVEPLGVSTEAGLWAWIKIDPETEGMEGSESGVQFFQGEDAKPSGFLPVEDMEVCAVHFSSLGDKLLIFTGTGTKQDVDFYLVDAANGSFVKKKSFASMGPAAWVDAHRFFFSAIDESRGFVGGHEGIWWASPSLYDTAEDEVIVIRKATATRNSAIIDCDPEAGTLTIMEMSVEDEKDWPDEDKVEFQELTLPIPAAGRSTLTR